jgi:hypothetical protein
MRTGWLAFDFSSELDRREPQKVVRFPKTHSKFKSLAQWNYSKLFQLRPSKSK